MVGVQTRNQRGTFKKQETLENDQKRTTRDRPNIKGCERKYM